MLSSRSPSTRCSMAATAADLRTAFAGLAAVSASEATRRRAPSKSPMSTRSSTCGTTMLTSSRQRNGSGSTSSRSSSMRRSRPRTSSSLDRGEPGGDALGRVVGDPLDLERLHARAGQLAVVGLRDVRAVGVGGEHLLHPGPELVEPAGRSRVATGSPAGGRAPARSRGATPPGRAPGTPRPAARWRRARSTTERATNCATIESPTRPTISETTSGPSASAAGSRRADRISSMSSGDRRQAAEAMLSRMAPSCSGSRSPMYFVMLRKTRSIAAVCDRMPPCAAPRSSSLLVKALSRSASRAMSASSRSASSSSSTASPVRQFSMIASQRGLLAGPALAQDLGVVDLARPRCDARPPRPARG